MKCLVSQVKKKISGGVLVVFVSIGVHEHISHLKIFYTVMATFGAQKTPMYILNEIQHS